MRVDKSEPGNHRAGRMRAARPLLAAATALRFLTALPLPGASHGGGGELAAAVAWFPLAGAVLGGALVATDWACGRAFPRVSHFLSAALVLAVYALLTGGLHLDGPVLAPPYQSFIGLYPIPLVHGMTIGELAQLFNGLFDIGADLTVVPMRGWTRRMIWQETGLPWVRPSPNIPTMLTPFYYAATGPLDGTNLWNGVATTSRFQVVLAPWIDGARLAARLNRRGLPGVRFSPSAVPHPRTGRVWRGVRLHVTDRAAFRPATTTVYVLAEIRDLHPGQLRFRLPRRGRALFDVVWGTKQVRVDLTRGLPAEAIVARWQPALRRFEALRSRYLLYE